MTTKLKIYVVSILAFSPLQDTSVPGESTYAEHTASMIPAESARAAALAAREYAYERWKLGEGWYGHQAAVMAVTRAFYDAAATAQRADVVDMSEDPGGDTFVFAEM